MENGYNLNEVARALGMKVRTVRQWVQMGRIKANKLAGSNRWIVLESEIMRLRGDKNENKN